MAGSAGIVGCAEVGVVGAVVAGVVVPEDGVAQLGETSRVAVMITIEKNLAGVSILRAICYSF